jgi:glycosyltransferase involved in cell wall biosynthesis
VRVLFITGEFPPMQGGVGDYTRELGLALSDLGCKVDVVAPTQARPVPGLTIHPIVERWDWRCWGTLLDLVRQCEPDVVHIQYQAAAYAMHPAINFWPWRMRRMGAGRPRSVVTFHDLKVPYLFPKAGPARRHVIKELARRSDAAIATNREDFEALSAVLTTLPALIPIGSNITPVLPADFDRDTWRSRWGAGPGDLVLCFFGFINERKGVDTLLHALQALVSDPPTAGNVALVFIGGRTGASDPTNVAYLAQMDALIAQLGLEDRIQWTGFVPAEEVTAGFEAADLCVLPYRDGVSLLHGTFHAALIHGVPIVTTKPRLPLPELIHGENVYLVAPGDAGALAAAIGQLAADEHLRQKLGAGARVLSEQFHWDTIAAETLALYRAIGAGL